MPRSGSSRGGIGSPIVFTQRIWSGATLVIGFFVFHRDTSSVRASYLEAVGAGYSCSTNRWSRSQVAKKSSSQPLYPNTR